MGIATVLSLALPFVLLGVFDLDTYIWMWIAFGVAGAVTAALYTHERVSAGEEARRVIDEAAAQDSE